MKSKLLLGIGIAAGYVLGSRSGRAAYDKLKARAASIWDSKPVQDKVSAAAEVIKEKAPEVADQLGEAARRAGTVIGSAVHHDAASGTSKSKTSDAGASVGAYSTAAAGSAAAGSTAVGDHVPGHSTHPDTVNLGTSDVESDPAFNDNQGQDWSGEGGATAAGAATNVDPRRE
ncbi:YtxH domain-containing protein [Pseudarthrobacter sp. SSS035]|uniref:YtxH domain-containing protein n=1 Tax=Pseudarthrobacter sp. SSS035 TaxID=2931399 RepID=UPI00200EB528|nr:YtxH domain-containing protein [Pseudarthrobacter sp. SSS035]